jgi:hypothetical protein
MLHATWKKDTEGTLFAKWENDPVQTQHGLISHRELIRDTKGKLVPKWFVTEHQE